MAGVAREHAGRTRRGRRVQEVERKREFAADMGVQSHALRMAAEGAVAAYEKVVGETWKPFERPVDNTTDTVGRKAAKAQMSAFD